MCSIEAHNRMHPTVNCDTSSSASIPMPPYSKEHVLVSLSLTLNFIDNWLQSFKTNYIKQTKMFCENE